MNNNPPWANSTVKLGYKNMLNRGNSGYRGQFAADRFFTK